MMNDDLIRIQKEVNAITSFFSASAPLDKSKDDLFDDAYAKFVSAGSKEDETYWFNQMLAQVEIRPHPIPKLVKESGIVQAGVKQNHDAICIAIGVMIFTIVMSIMFIMMT